MKFIAPLIVLVTALSTTAFPFSVFPKSPDIVGLSGLRSTSLVISDGTIRIIYQAIDTSIHVFQPLGLPGSGFTDITVVKAGVAKNDTPVAAVNVVTTSNAIAIYFFGNGTAGTLLNEAVGLNNGSNWGITGFGSLGFNSAPGNELLYANPWPAGGPSGRRVGMQFAGGNLGEAICLSTSCWFTALY